MDIIEKRLNEIIVFKLNGNLNSNTSPALEDKIFEAIKNESKNMILDCEDLDYISSAGLRVIMKAAKNLKQSEGMIVLCSMQDYVKEVFEIAGFDAYLPIVPTMDDALNQF